MNKLKLMKNSIAATAFLSFVILIAMSFTLVIFPLAYYQSIARISEEDLEGYSEELGDYCVVSFAEGKNLYKDLAQKIDMENFAGIAEYGFVEIEIPDEEEPRGLKLSFISEKAVKNLPSLGYNFSKTKPKDYKEAYAPQRMRDVWKVGKIYEISIYEGEYQYSQKIKILGYSENNYYNFSNAITNSYITYSPQLLIFDDIPPYATVGNGLMMNAKKPEYYKNLGVNANTLRNANMQSRMSNVYDFFLYWCICGIALLIVIVAANYYFAADKLIKRSGVMYIFGGKRTDVLLIEMVKMLMLFVLSFAISIIPIGIVIKEVQGNVLVDWATYFICLGIIFAIYLLSILPGFVKLARFKPLKAIANNNVE